jgi:hypothetical protein
LLSLRSFTWCGLRILTTQDTATFQDGVAHHARCWEAKMRRMKKI